MLLYSLHGVGVDLHFILSLILKLCIYTRMYTQLSPFFQNAVKEREKSKTVCDFFPIFLKLW